MRINYLFFVLGAIFFLASCSSDVSENLDTELNSEVETREGCENCKIFLRVDRNCNISAFVGKGCIGKISYQWTTPHGPYNIPSPTATVNGNYCVTITTSTGCWATACTNIRDCKDDCDNDCIEVGFSDTEKCKLEVNFNECESKPTNIIWSTPLNIIPVGPSVSADVDGVYCASVTFADGCQYTDCINIKSCEEFCEDDCTIEIELNNSGTDCYLDVISYDCLKPLEIEWTYPSGATTNYHRISMSVDGTYCVKITQINGCELTECIDIENCDEASIVPCDDFELEWVDFEDGEEMWRDDGSEKFLNVFEYQPGSQTNPVAYLSGESFEVSATFHTNCVSLESIFIRGVHWRPDGTQLIFPPQQIFVDPNGVILYEFDHPYVSGAVFKFPDEVEFHDPFSIEWQYSPTNNGSDWTLIYTSENPVYVCKNQWNSSPGFFLCPLAENLRFHTYFRNSCEAADGLSDPVGIANAVWGVFSGTDFSRADGSPLLYYGDWTTSVYCSKDLILQGDGQCTAHSAAYLNCLKAQGINESNDFLIVTPQVSNEYVGLLVNEFQSNTITPFAAWSNGPPSVPLGFTIEKVVISNVTNYNAIASDFDGNILYSEIDDLSGVAGQNNPNPKAYFGNHQIVTLFGEYYDAAYGTTTYGFPNSNLATMMEGNLYGYIVKKQANINESILGIDLNNDNDTLDTSVNVTVWLIDTDPENLTFDPEEHNWF